MATLIVFFFLFYSTIQRARARPVLARLVLCGTGRAALAVENMRRGHMFL